MAWLQHLWRLSVVRVRWFSQGLRSSRGVKPFHAPLLCTAFEIGENLCNSLIFCLTWIDSRWFMANCRLLLSDSSHHATLRVNSDLLTNTLHHSYNAGKDDIWIVEYGCCKALQRQRSLQPNTQVMSEVRCNKMTERKSSVRV